VDQACTRISSRGFAQRFASDPYRLITHGGANGAATHAIGKEPDNLAGAPEAGHPVFVPGPFASHTMHTNLNQ